MEGVLDMNMIMKGLRIDKGIKSHLNLSHNKAHNEIQQGKKQTLKGGLGARQALEKSIPITNLSFKDVGFSNPSKKLALIRLVNIQNIDVVMVQENTREGENIIGLCIIRFHKEIWCVW